MLGHMDPISEVSGVQMRLAGLGYFKGAFSSEIDDATTKALVAFQRAEKLPETGGPDKDTLAALAKAFGC